MIQKMFIKTIVIGLIFTFIGYTQTVESAQKGSKKVKESQGILKVKGFYIGMNIDEVPALLKEKLPEIKVTDVQEKGNVYLVAAGYSIPNTVTAWEVLMNKASLVNVIADEDKKVTMIGFEGKIVDELFNVANLDVKKFVKKFMESYEIPDMDIIQEDNGLYYTYTNPAGFKILISAETKALIIQKVATESEQKFD